MDEYEKREFAYDFILDMVRDPSFADVNEALWDDTGEEDEELAREIWTLIRNAKVEVKFD